MHDKIIDALNSVSTAKKKGVVAGAGLTYWNLAELLDHY
jgi:chaperonin GroEL (HSP60 family)